MEKVTVINIGWEKVPFDFEIIKQKTGNSEYGLYQVYGHHPSYGDDALLYLGQANEQDFGTRLKERWEFIESCARPTFFRLGRILQSKDKDEPLGWDINRWGQMIGIAERILIKAHTPAMNKQENSGLFLKDLSEFNRENFLIINWYDYGKLSPEISTLRMSYRYWDFVKPLSI